MILQWSKITKYKNQIVSQSQSTIRYQTFIEKYPSISLHSPPGFPLGSYRIIVEQNQQKYPLRPWLDQLDIKISMNCDCILWGFWLFLCRWPVRQAQGKLQSIPWKQWERTLMEAWNLFAEVLVHLIPDPQKIFFQQWQLNRFAIENHLAS